MGCVADVETGEDVGEAVSAMGRCTKPCNEGGAVLLRYCNNRDLVPAERRDDCITFSKSATNQCNGIEPDYQCYSACGYLAYFDNFCRGNGEILGCWTASLEAHGKCKKVAPRR
jgi:hypothetical protein